MNWPSSAYKSKTDQELLTQYHNTHNNKWVGILLERYLHLIFGVCMKYLGDEEEAKDHTQQICLQVLKNISKHEITYFKSWLYQVAKNHCLMELRKNKNIHIQPLEEHPAAGYTEPPPGEPAEDENIKLEYLHLAMERLNDAQRSCLDLFFFKKKSYQEISLATGYTLNQVKSHIQNGKRNLRQIIERNTGDQKHHQ